MASPPCGVDTPRCSAATNYHKATPRCCIEHQVAVMDHVASVMGELDIAWWADYGTLLGAVRNQGVIPHDKDGDISMMGEGWERLLSYRPEVPWVERKGRRGLTNLHRLIDGFAWIHMPERNASEWGGGWMMKVRRSETNTNNVDIFPWWKKDDGTYYRKRYIGCDRYKGREFPESRLLPLSEIEWEGRMIPAPADPEWFCLHRYGSAWRTPLRRNNDGRRR